MTKPKALAKGKLPPKKKLTPKAKEALLTKAHTRSKELMFGNRSLDKVEEMVAADVMGYGTTVEEKMFGLSGYLELLRRQREQSAEIEMKLTEHPVFRRLSAAMDAAVVVDEIEVDLLTGGQHYKLHVRLTTIYEFAEGVWKLIHWHGSKPEYESGGADTWHVGEWQNKTAELERQVEEKTHDLTLKNRALEIESALEKVRSASLAMHSSTDLAIVAGVIFDKLVEMGLSFNGALIFVFDHERKNIDLWIATTQLAEPTLINLPFDEAMMNNAIMTDLWKAINDGEDIVNRAYTGPSKNDYFEYVSKHNLSKIPAEIIDLQQTAESWTGTFVAEKNCLLGFDSWTGRITPAADIEILKRFAAVFEQAYVRFLDLQKAEAQTKEALIESALERVRGKAMAMHTSTDLKDVVRELRKQLSVLGQRDLETFVIHLHDESPDNIQAWAAVRPPDSAGDILEANIPVPKKGLEIIEESLNYYEAKRGDYVIVNDGNKATEWLNFMQQKSPETVDRIMESRDKSSSKELRAYWSFSDFAGGSLLLVTLEPPADSARSLLRRFANVFGLAYRRFADLRQAELQAHEAKIEASLERVRGKAMAMHSSGDLAATAGLVFGELRKLGINPIRSGIGLIDETMRTGLLYSATLSADGDGLSVVGSVLLSSHPVLTEVFEHWKEKKDYFPDLSGVNLVSYYAQLLQGLPVPVPQFGADEHQYGHFIPFSAGSLYAWSGAPYHESEVKILKRFAAILDLTFRRYSELQKSEAITREAIKQAALDRIRADIASMRNVADLDRITPLIWNELNTLGVPFIRCGVFIMDQKEKQIHTFLSTPEGKAIAAFHIPFDDPGNIGEALRHWEKQAPYVGKWDQQDFSSLADMLVEQGSIANREQYLNSLPAGGFWLHFLPFLQGMLYVGNTEKLGDEHINLIQSLASAFSTAYARYEDFKKLQLAKVQVENTLSELKQAQQQLIQSEKMASLGELTAGIAHEIQNPLNFVNNFSELNNELLREIVDELEKGNFDDVRDLARSVGENQEKINFHGKRAEGIVKGMLQHSRTSSSQKELTDLNSLSDEYLRLAYHGMRAKDKSFNATFETDFDASLPKINLVPQDMGRVILNLVNNAFYAVTEKKKTLQGDYSPLVRIATKKISATEVALHISDNGDGIPAKIVDKVFQPFFTTKPTGQGTGLGLSLAYDIIKAHGGEIKIETEQGEGTRFVIRLYN